MEIAEAGETGFMRDLDGETAMPTIYNFGSISLELQTLRHWCAWMQEIEERQVDHWSLLGELLEPAWHTTRILGYILAKPSSSSLLWVVRSILQSDVCEKSLNTIIKEPENVKLTISSEQALS